MNGKCSSCGKFANTLYVNSLCQGCYNYFRNGGQVYNPPNAGTIEYDHRGYVICHICGKAYKRLGSHARETHNLTIKEYKEMFGLCNNCKTTEQTYSMTMRENAYKYEMPQRLMIAGKATRIKPGEKDKRLGKPVRLQECLQKKRKNA